MPLDTCEDLTCPHCSNDDDSMIDLLVWIPAKNFSSYHCNICGKDFTRIEDNKDRKDDESNNQSSEFPSTGNKTG